MITKIFVFEFPSLMDEITSIFEDTFEKPKAKKCNFKRDLTPPKFKVRNEFGKAPLPEWGIGGEEADDNLRFGYGLNVDEPMYQNFSNDDDFLKAREAFDDFVDAGERCVKLGLDKRNDAPITKCSAIRKPIGCQPPMNVSLLGESQFPWWEIDMDWEF